MSCLAMLKMIQISDSLFPIGSFTLSNGLETFVSNGSLASDADLEEYLDTWLDLLPYQDLGCMMLACTHADDMEYLERLDRLSLALKAPKEVRTGSSKLCSRFLKLWEKICDYAHIGAYRQSIRNGHCLGNHAVAVGLYVKDIGLSVEEGAAVYAYSLLTAVVTNAVKTVPFSQISGQRILAQNLERIEDCVKKAAEISLEELGVGGTGFDIASMQHEILYSRLYMS